MPGLDLRLSLPEAREAVDVRCVLDLPPAISGPGVVLTHGAGGDAFGPGLGGLAGGLVSLGHPVARFNLPFRERGRRTPPAAERSTGAFAAAFEAVRATPEGAGAGLWAAGGKSYGGRVASLAAAGGLNAGGLVFYGYPLHPPGRPESLRTDHWPEIRVPCLFLQGSQDPFCDLGLLRRNLPRLGGPASLHVVEGGHHSLKAPGRSEREVLAGLAPVVSDWLRGLPG